MYNKKGGIDFVLTLPAILFIIVLVIAFFFVMFFVVGVESPNLVINSASYEDSSTIITLLKSPVEVDNQNITIAELISLAYHNQNYKSRLTTELNSLLARVPTPIEGEDLADVNVATLSSMRKSVRDVNWNMDITIDNTRFLRAGESTTLPMYFFNQTTIIPLENNKLARVTLYMTCFGCGEEQINEIA